MKQFFQSWPLSSCVHLQHEADSGGEQASMLAKLLFETALLESGFQLADNKAFNQRVYSLVKDVLNIKTDVTTASAPAEVRAGLRGLGRLEVLGSMVHTL